MLSYIVCMLSLSMPTINAQIQYLSTTFYVKQLQWASIDSSNALYSVIHLCPSGIAQKTQAMLQISAPENPEWNTANKPFIAVQVSICPGSFTTECVIAQNYIWGPQVKAISNISWQIGNETAYYIRAMAGYETSKFSMELSFTNKIKNHTSFPGTEGKPFDGTQMSSTPAVLDQYWTAENLYTVGNFGDQKFSLAYCDQGQNIEGIDIALSTLTYDLTDYSLVQQWACTSATKVEDCTATNYDWNNPHVASFNHLRCDNKKASTKNGIIVGVSGDGGNLDKLNTFIFAASCFN